MMRELLHAHRSISAMIFPGNGVCNEFRKPLFELLTSFRDHVVVKGVRHNDEFFAAPGQLICSHTRLGGSHLIALGDDHQEGRGQPLKVRFTIEPRANEEAGWQPGY